MSSHEQHRGDRVAARATIAGSAALTAAAVPAFLVGALSARMTDDLGEVSTGAVVTAFFLGAGLSAVPMGRVAERVGARDALRLGALIVGAAELAVAGLAGEWWQVAVLLFVAGWSVGLVDTGAARAFVDAVPERRHGLAFGVKEASVPAASLLAGLSIPLLAQQLGWRAAFVAGALLVPLVWLLVPLDRPRPSRAVRGEGAPVRLAPLALFAAGVALGTAAATAAATLLVPAFDDRGWSETAAGLLLAGVSSVSIATRLGAGWSSDRRPGSSWLAAGALMGAGALGATLLAATDAGAGGVVGAVLVVGAGWGWTGLAFQTATRVTPALPAVAAGIVLTGLSVGGALGPAAFGAVASAASYGAAWAAAASAFGLGAAATIAARRWQLRLAGAI